MKTYLYILLIIIVLTSCKREGVGTVIYKIKFTTNEINERIAKPIKNEKSGTDSLYTNFGDYITSLTPTKFTAKILTIGYCNSVLTQGNNNTQMIQYINQNSEDLPENDPSRLIDFSNNVTITFEDPKVFGRKKDGILSDRKIDFKYFYFLPMYLYQEVQLPEEYNGIQLDMFPSNEHSVIENNVLKTQHQPIIKKIFPNSNNYEGPYFYFGNTDSTFIVNPNGEAIPTSENNPIIGIPTSVLIIRSNKYSNTIYHAPGANETLIMNGIVSFNTTNLIQVYAGADNIPFTSDDVFVYAPKFWERVSSILETN